MPGCRLLCRFFKTYFLDVCLDLTADPVPNVRLHLAALLPALKQSIRQAGSAIHVTLLLSNAASECYMLRSYRLFLATDRCFVCSAQLY